jgi:hypothetical protein
MILNPPRTRALAQYVPLVSPAARFAEPPAQVPTLTEPSGAFSVEPATVRPGLHVTMVSSLDLIRCTDYYTQGRQHRDSVFECPPYR